MALNIVNDSSGAVPTDVKKSSRWSCDIFTGTADALVSAGLITLEQLKPQKGRRAGYTVFLPDGSPCHPTQRAWREPGFKTIFEVNDGTYIVEVTVAKDVQLWRRKAERAAQHEAEQERINKELAEHGHEYRNWTLRHEYAGFAETWEGTKAQLQAQGLAVGMKFPGEPGAPDEIHCKCPLGFDVRIYQPSYSRGRAAAGIYIAQSFYVPYQEEPKQYVAHAPGVLLEVVPEWNTRTDTYVGTAQALVNANLVPSLALFPGQAGQNKVRASFLKGWVPAVTSTGRNWLATIRKKGNKGQYSVEVPVSKREEERREALRTSRNKEQKQKELALAQERRELRQLATVKQKSVEEFRSQRAEVAEIWLGFLWNRVFVDKDGPLSFEIPENCELRDDLADAFQTIRDAVQTADILRDNKLQAAAQTRLKLVAARNDKGLQSLLHDAKHLRLVHSSPEQ